MSDTRRRRLRYGLGGRLARVGQYRNRKIHEVDLQTGAIVRTVESNCFFTGVARVDDELWHGNWEADQSELLRIDVQSVEALEQVDMPPGISVSGLESNGGDTFFRRQPQSESCP